MKKITFLLLLLVVTVSHSQIDEGFEDVAGLTDYLFINSSDQPDFDAAQGLPPASGFFNAFEGSPNSYLLMDFEVSLGTIADYYVMTPKLRIKNGDVISFYTRAIEGSENPDRLEVRIGDGTDVLPTRGNPDNVGSYTNLLLSLNPDLEIGGYPEVWKKLTIEISGLAAPVETRVAFRYWITDNDIVNGDAIGIDSFTVSSDILSTDEVTLNDFSKYYDAENDKLHITAANAFKAIEVYSLLGQEVINKSLSSAEEVIDFSNISDGAYIVKVLSEEGIAQNFKIIKY